VAVKPTLVNVGDIIQSDDSWRINTLKFSDHKEVEVGQNFRSVADTSHPQSVVILVGSNFGQSETYYPSENFVDMNGPTASESSELRVGDRYVPISEIAAEEDINVRNKIFTVVAADRTTTYESGPRTVTARESEADGVIKPGGLKVHFLQTAQAEPEPPAEYPYVHEVKVIGHLIR